MKQFIPATLLVLLATGLQAQTKHADSLQVVSTFKELLRECRQVDFKDPKVVSEGIFYKAAKYIVYRGDDKVRAWKDYANYSDSTEKEGVNSVCESINQSVNQDSIHYKITKYLSKKESEGTWHVLYVSYLKKGKVKHANFAFLKIKGRFGLGDID